MTIEVTKDRSGDYLVFVSPDDDDGIHFNFLDPKDVLDFLASCFKSA